MLTPLPVVHSRASLPPDQFVQEQIETRAQGAQGQDGTQEAENATNPNKAKDPCKHQEKHGQKPKPKKQCLPDQSSGGVAKDDFNGDGFAAKRPPKG